MAKDIRDCVRACHGCQTAKTGRHTKIELESIPIASERFTEVHLDITKLPDCEGFCHILTMTDRFSRWIEAVPLRDASTENIMKSIETNWLSIFGIPARLISDSGSQFTPEQFSEFCKLLDIRHITTVAHNLRANGIDERQHRILKEALRAKEVIKWLDHLPLILFGMRTTVEEPSGCSSAQLVYGEPLRLQEQSLEGGIVSFRESEYELEKRLSSVMAKIKPKMSEIQQASVYIPKSLSNADRVYVRDELVNKVPYRVIHRDKKLFYYGIDMINSYGPPQASIHVE